MFNSLQPYGLQPARLLYPRDFPGKNTGVACHALLQRIFLTQWSNPHHFTSPVLAGGFFTTSSKMEYYLGIKKKKRKKECHLQQYICNQILVSQTEKDTVWYHLQMESKYMTQMNLSTKQEVLWTQKTVLQLPRGRGLGEGRERDWG